ncbi:threonine/serine exporter family protein [Gaoshiqia sp. Z1-71]|uniref:threonine/serine exporter family protein n=1 Tax=Gaoshiqia hydrogeniformans TaxID=3290090 RepID=UPI003BF7890F
MEWIVFVEKWVWLGFAALGFAILFNVPLRTLWPAFVLGALGGVLKLVTMSLGGGIILGSFLGAVLIGFMSIAAAHYKHAPPMVFAIPAVIPMVPGAFAYRMMIGIIKLTGDVDPAIFVELMNDTVNNGLKALFILLSLSLGVSAPMLLTRRESAKEIKVSLRIDELIKK